MNSKLLLTQSKRPTAAILMSAALAGIVVNMFSVSAEATEPNSKAQTVTNSSPDSAPLLPTKKHVAQKLPPMKMKRRVSVDFNPSTTSPSAAQSGVVLADPSLPPNKKVKFHAQETPPGRAALPDEASASLPQAGSAAKAHEVIATAPAVVPIELQPTQPLHSNQLLPSTQPPSSLNSFNSPSSNNQVPVYTLREQPVALLPQPAPSAQTQSWQVIEPEPSTHYDLATVQAHQPKSELSQSQSDRRFALKASYLDAQYKQLEGDLRNGASSVGLEWSRNLAQLWPKSWGSSAEICEFGLGLDLYNGYDLSWSVANTRMTLVHAALQRDLRIFNSTTVRLFAGGGFGLAAVNFRTWRQQPDGSIALKEQLQGNYLSLQPLLDLRWQPSRSADQAGISFDLTLQYLGLFGNGDASALGGFAPGLAVGYPL